MEGKEGRPCAEKNIQLLLCGGLEGGRSTRRRKRWQRLYCVRFRPAFFLSIQQSRSPNRSVFFFFFSYACRILNLSFFFFHSEKRKTWLEESVHRCPSYASMPQEAESTKKQAAAGHKKDGQSAAWPFKCWPEKKTWHQGSSEREVNRSRAGETRNFFDLMDNYFIFLLFFSILRGN